jgi:hypothetical protein
VLFCVWDVFLCGRISRGSHTFSKAEYVSKSTRVESSTKAVGESQTCIGCILCQFNRNISLFWYCAESKAHVKVHIEGHHSESKRTSRQISHFEGNKDTFENKRILSIMLQFILTLRQLSMSFTIYPVPTLSIYVLCHR